MTDSDVRQLRDELQELKIEMTDRLARIETKLENTRGSGTSASQALSKSAMELGKLALQVVAAVIAALLAVRGGGTP